MALVPLQHVVPPGGFHFVDRSGGVETRIEGESFEDVASRVLKHRLANGRPPGDPLKELMEYVCGTWPHFCRETEPAEQQPPAQNRSYIQTGGGLATRVATWMARFVQSARDDRGVGLTETQRRAEICVQCPKNQEFRGGCGSCVDNINRLFFLFRRDRELPYEHQLRGCEVLGQHNGAAALAGSLPAIASDVAEQLPAACWRRNP